MMTMELNNLKYLERYFLNIYQAVKLASAQEGRYELTENRNGSFNILTDQLTNGLLYSKYDPVYEAQRWCESLEYVENNEDDIIFFGLGLTYHLSALVEQFPNRKIIIYEPEIGLFQQLIKIADLTALLNHPNIKHIAVGKDESTVNEFIEFVKKYCTFQYQYVRIPFYDKLTLDTEKALLEQLKKVDLEKKALQGFHKTFGRKMYINTMRNIPKILNMPVLKTLEQRFPNTTAVIVGGGPSLQYDIDCIKRNYDKWFIIAAGSSVQNLSYHGIKPHLIVSMDPGIYNGEIFRKESYEDIPMLIMPQIYHEILEIHDKNNLYAYYNNDPVINYLIPYHDQNYVIKPTYSVTGTAIQAAIYIGANRIIFTGQDLSYPNNQLYAMGTAHINEEKRKEKEQELLNEVLNVDGKRNPTSFSMLQTLRDIEKLISNFDHITFINSSRSGARINGTTFEKMESLSTSSPNYDFSDLKKQINEFAIYHTIDTNSILKKSEDTLDFLCCLIDNTSINLEKVNKLTNVIKNNPATAKSYMQDITESLNKIFNKKIFKEYVSHWFIIELNLCEQQLIEAEREKSVVRRAEIYKRAFTPLLETMKNILPIFIEEQIYLIDQMKHGQIKETGE